MSNYWYKSVINIIGDPTALSREELIKIKNFVCEVIEEEGKWIENSARRIAMDIEGASKAIELMKEMDQEK